MPLAFTQEDFLVPVSFSLDPLLVMRDPPEIQTEIKTEMKTAEVDDPQLRSVSQGYHV